MKNPTKNLAQPIVSISSSLILEFGSNSTGPYFTYDVPLYYYYYCGITSIIIIYPISAGDNSYEFDCIFDSK